MRIAGSASRSMMAAASPGIRKSIMTPVTRALHMAAVLLDHGGQPVLLLELVAADLLALEHAGADDRPVMAVAGIEQVVEIDRLVRAMEIADAEMHDAGASARRDRIAARRHWRQLARLSDESLTVMAHAFRRLRSQSSPAHGEKVRREGRHDLRAMLPLIRLPASSPRERGEERLDPSAHPVAAVDIVGLGDDVVGCRRWPGTPPCRSRSAAVPMRP